MGFANVEIFFKLKGNKEIGVFAALAILILTFSIISEHFLSLGTMSAIATVCTEMGILAIGATILMIAGEFDLSIGSNFALSGMVFALLTVNYEMNSFLAALIALVVGASIGLVNAAVTIKTRIPSFITTLGTMLIVRGIVLIVTDGFPVAALDDTLLTSALSYDLGGGFKASIFVWLGFGALFFYFLSLHPFGNRMMATGGNEEAAFSMGIKVVRVKVLCFVTTGVLSALAGIIQYSHLMSLSPTAGEQYELRAIAIAVIGGTSLSGGYGTIVGTIIATIIMGVLASGLVQAGVSTYWFRTLIGVILVLAVVMNTRIKTLSEKAS